MPFRDPKCVHVAENIGQADIVASWLQEQGISAEVMTRNTMGMLGYPLLTTATGVEIWVMDPEQAQRAIQLLGDHTVERVTSKPTGPPVQVVCDECGQTSIFPAEQQGSVQDCPHCNAYIDVEPPDGAEHSQGPGQPNESEDKGPTTDGITDEGPWGMQKH